MTESRIFISAACAMKLTHILRKQSDGRTLYTINSYKTKSVQNLLSKHFFVELFVLSKNTY